MKRFLLVDDEINVLNALQRTLRQRIGSSELTIEILTDPVEALERIGETAFDLVISDYRMPIMNGIEFLQKVKQDHLLKRIPVVVLTTSEEQQDKMSSFNLGVAGYMAKPVDYQQFVAMMRSIDLYWTISEMT